MQKPFDVEFMETSDGSHTLRLIGADEQYHSRNGALQESQHVFIRAGLHSVMHLNDPLHILEVGMGTGLNALLTCIESVEGLRKILYHALEPFPLDPEIVEKLNYPRLFSQNWVPEAFQAIHGATEDPYQCVGDVFFLKRFKTTVQEASLADNVYNLVYFDAFGPDTQPEMWTTDVFCRIAKWMQPQGVLVTYCAKGAVRRALKSAGFQVERLPGPPGKREMTRAVKL